MSIIGQLEENRIASCNLSNDKLTLSVEEACDCYFAINLDKAEVSKLIDELTDIRDSMKESEE